MENDRIKVLIGDDTAALGIRIASALSEKGLYAYTRKGKEDILFNSIIKDEPDVVISPLSYPESDAIVLMKEIERAAVKKPAFIIISEMYNSFIERQVIENGAAYYLSEPYDYDMIGNIIKGVADKKVDKKSRDVEIIVTDVIRKLGVPAHIKGYHYLRCAILGSIKDLRLMECVTKQLYPFVAQQYDTTSSRVERAIRHAIEIAWTRGNTDEINNYFGYRTDNYKCRPTNSEFIALITDKLRLQLKNSGEI